MLPRRFSQELFDYIIDCAGYEYDALETCSTVCRRWTIRSRSHLFKNLYIREPIHPNRWYKGIFATTDGLNMRRSFTFVPFHLRAPAVESIPRSLLHFNPGGPRTGRLSWQSTPGYGFQGSRTLLTVWNRRVPNHRVLPQPRFKRMLRTIRSSTLYAISRVL